MDTIEKLIQKADTYFVEKKYSEAILAYDQALSEVYKEAAASAHKTKDQMTQEDYMKFMRQNERYSRLITNKGVCAINSVDFALAGNLFDSAISVMPAESSFGDPYFYLAFVKYVSGLPYEDALKEGFKRDVSLQSRHQQLYDSFKWLLKENTGNAFEKSINELGKNSN